MRIGKIAVIGAGGVAAVLGARALKQARDKRKNGRLPTDRDVVEEVDRYVDDSKGSL